MIALAAILSTWTPQAAREAHKAAGPIHTRPQGGGADPHKATMPKPAIHTRPVAGGCFECGEPVEHAGPPVRDGRMVVCFECGLCWCGAPAAHLEPLPRCLEHAADFENDELEDLDW